MHESLRSLLLRLALTHEIKVQVVRYSDRKYLMPRYVDPITGKLKSRSSGTLNRREAERAANKWETQLAQGILRKPTRISWSEFRERYETEKLNGLSHAMATASASAFNHIESIINPQNLIVLDADTLSRFQAGLRATKMEESSIATHLRHLRAALSWAATMKFIPTVPEIAMPKRAKGRKFMRGRPVTDEEFERLILAVGDVRSDDIEIWRLYLRGLWLSGLRLTESVILSWDVESPFSIDLGGRRPRFRIEAGADKGNQDRFLPMTPDFAELILSTPRKDRDGKVFKLFSTRGELLTANTVGEIVSRIGKAAGIVVNKKKNKYASAHDLRRSFGTRWATRVMPVTLQLLMRHRSIETTMKYYVDQDADLVADGLWELHAKTESKGKSSMEGTTPA